MDPTNPSATASGAAVLPTCSTISSASTQQQPYGAFGGAVGTTSGHASTGSGPGGGGGGDNANNLLSPTLLSPGTNTGTASIATSRDEEDDSSNQASSGSKGSGQRRASALRTSPEAHTSLVSRAASEDVWQPGGYQTMWQQQPPLSQQQQQQQQHQHDSGGAGSSSGRRGHTTMAHYQSIDRSQSFNGSDRMSRWYQYHQQRHPLSRTSSHRHGSQQFARRFSLRDVEDDDDYDDDDAERSSGGQGSGSGIGISSSILNRMVSYDSVAERGDSLACGGLLTRHRVSHPSVASSSLDGRFATSLGSLSSHQPPQAHHHHDEQLQQHHQHQQQHEQQLSKSISNGTTRGAQSWKNLRAVMAYYCSLRKIKRNARKVTIADL
ncbi:hypothetical protein AND_006144 [Anopheles darlingi]|uniref:Uncharacterized protein n=1 Tax=Anopheles darlingi TaxID=43151 RepID=W5JH81_ANODA|nr:hypothetical protein AND_006144 [Anopheles darlingi]